MLTEGDAVLAKKGKPSRGTKKDKRLKRNNGKATRTGVVKMMRAAGIRRQPRGGYFN